MMHTWVNRKAHWEETLGGDYILILPACSSNGRWEASHGPALARVNRADHEGTSWRIYICGYPIRAHTATKSHLKAFETSTEAKLWVVRNFFTEIREKSTSIETPPDNSLEDLIL